MKVISVVKRFWIPLAVFVLTTAGLATLLPHSDDNADASIEIPTVVMTTDMPAGTDADIVRTNVEIRMLPTEARAIGALQSILDIPEGLLNSHHVIGQQVLTSSFDVSRVRAFGDDYVSLSIRLDPQRWTGPYSTAGQRVNIYEVQDGTNAVLISADAIIINAPSITDLKPDDKSVVTFGVRRGTVAAVIVAATNEKIWVTSR